VYGKPQGAANISDRPQCYDSRPVAGDWIELKVDDGTTMRAYSVRAAGQRPAVLIFQEAYGVNGHIRDVCHRFAAEGWDALAPELFHRTAPGFEGRYDDSASAMRLVQTLTDDGLTADIRAAHAQFKGKRIDAVGFCMGGRVSYLAAATVPLHAAISFYGGRIAPALLPRAAELSAPFLMFWGGLDKHIPPEQHRPVADALRAAGKMFIDVEISDGDHGFFCDQRPSYNPRAAAEAWALTLTFLRGR
jgi:carboxymethylenebutenolidase